MKNLARSFLDAVLVALLAAFCLFVAAFFAMKMAARQVLRLAGNRPHRRLPPP